eukprot:comp4015_c0_seq1/m.2349 comp4015_c0_seq1/g.2349  ORF comp4015_c0_seq1/g.2349 comp4015_c0_seq1/m.2349 type:complete len:320 (+) comp4015_c0_seq1:69-1028(+)
MLAAARGELGALDVAILERSMVCGEPGLVAGHGICAVLDEQTHNLAMVALHSMMECRGAIAADSVCVGAAVEQGLDGSNVSAGCGMVDGHDAVGVWEIRVCAIVEQQDAELATAVARCGVECSELVVEIGGMHHSDLFVEQVKDLVLALVADGAVPVGKHDRCGLVALGRRELERGAVGLCGHCVLAHSGLEQLGNACLGSAFGGIVHGLVSDVVAGVDAEARLDDGLRGAEVADAARIVERRETRGIGVRDGGALCDEQRDDVGEALGAREMERGGAVGVLDGCRGSGFEQHAHGHCVSDIGGVVQCGAERLVLHIEL